MNRPRGSFFSFFLFSKFFSSCSVWNFENDRGSLCWVCNFNSSLVVKMIVRNTISANVALKGIAKCVFLI
ncbi:hypothetical protein ACB092_08G017300 [Castanea dentata]